MNAGNEEKIIVLLEEIRDIQKKNTENYYQALKYQEEGIRISREAMKRQKKFLLHSLIVIAILVIVGLLLRP